MANLLAIHSVANSIMTFLRNTYPPNIAGQPAPDCTFDVLSSGELAGDLPDAARLTLYLYRVTINEHSRQARPAAAPHSRLLPLGLDLHFLLTAWAGNALNEHVMLSWAMRQLHLNPILDASFLSPEAGWGQDEVIQLIPAELSNEDMMRIWDALEPPFRLSVSYTARLVRLDPDSLEPDSLPVVARRFTYGEELVP